MRGGRADGLRDELAAARRRLDRVANLLAATWGGLLLAALVALINFVSGG